MFSQHLFPEFLEIVVSDSSCVQEIFNIFSVAGGVVEPFFLLTEADFAASSL